MFKNAQVGDKVFDYTLQKWGTIINIRDTSVYSLEVSYENENISIILVYTKEGYINEYCILPVLFWDEVKPITSPRKPLPKLDVDTKVLVWGNHTSYKYYRHFCEFNKDGKIVTYPSGQTSWSYNPDYFKESWDKWELAE